MLEKNNELFAGLIIGTTKTVMIAAEKESGCQDSLHLVGFGSVPSCGVADGVIVSVTDAAHSIRRAFKELTDITGIPPERLLNVIAAFNASDVVNESVSVTLEFTEPQIITQDTLREAADQARKSLKGDGTMFPVHIFPEKYELDGVETDNPLGKNVTHFEVRLNAVMIPVFCAANVVNSVRSAGLKVKGLVLKTLASSLGAVSDEEKNAGCVSVNIGGSVTGTVIYKNGRASRIYSISRGGVYITQYIAFVLHVSLKEARVLQHRIFSPDTTEEALRAEGVDAALLGRTIAEALEENFILVRENLTDTKSCKNIVLSGGVSLMQGIDKMLEKFMHVPVRRVEKPLLSMPVGLGTAEFVSEAGIVKYFAEEQGNPFWLQIEEKSAE